MRVEGKRRSPPDARRREPTARRYLWDVAAGLGSQYFPGDNEIKVSIVFFALWEAMDTVLGLPVSLYSTFVVEQRHGFNKSTVGLYIAGVGSKHHGDVS